MLLVLPGRNLEKKRDLLHAGSVALSKHITGAVVAVIISMVVWFTTTYAISTYHHWCYEFESWSGRGVQHYVIKFVSYLG